MWHMGNIQTAIAVPNPNEWTDTATAVKLTGLSRSTLYAMCEDGRLPFYRIGALRVFWRDDVVKLAQAIKLVRGGEPR
jgi:excisionase family DNA binding protein